MSTSREFLVPESRETILNRYPSSPQSPRHPRRLHPDDDIPPLSRRYPQYASTSRRSSPQRSDNLPRGYRLQNSHSSSHVPPEYRYNDEEPPTHGQQRNYHSMNRAHRGYDRDQFEGYHSDYDYRRSVPGSPAASSRSSRANSPTNSIRSESKLHSPPRSSRRGSPASSVYSSRFFHCRCLE